MHEHQILFLPSVLATGLSVFSSDEIVLFNSDIAAVQGSAPFFKKCVEKVRTSKKCPVCTRGFDSQSDVDKVINTVSTYITLYPLI